MSNIAAFNALQSTHWTLALVYKVHPAQTRVDKEVVTLKRYVISRMGALAHEPTTVRGVALGVPYFVQVVHISIPRLHERPSGNSVILLSNKS